MKIETIEESMRIALKNLENIEEIKKYQNDVIEYLTENKVTDEIITVVVKGFNIDQGINFFDYLDNISNEELKVVWLKIKKNKEIKENNNNNGISFLIALFSFSFMNNKLLFSQKNIVINLIMTIIGVKKRKLKAEIYEPIIKEYIIDYFPENFEFPEWEIMELDGWHQKEFAKIVLDIIEKENGKKKTRIWFWANKGIQLADIKIEKEEIEKKIPKSKIYDLQNLLEHYQNVEENYRTLVYDNVDKDKTIADLQIDKKRIVEEKNTIAKETEFLKNEIELLKGKLKSLEEKLEAHKNINDSFNLAKEKEKNAIFKDIGRALRNEYKDFVKSQEFEMSDILGEVYREKLKSVFKILAENGINME